MSRLGRFERKKSFMSAKNLLLFALLIASVLTLLIPGTIAYQKEQSKRRKSYSELSSAGGVLRTGAQLSVCRSF